MADPTALFTTAEARAFNGGVLADTTRYLTADITAKEAEIRAAFARICGVQFIPTTEEEAHDGDGTDSLILDWPKPISITSITIDGTALSATAISQTDYAEGLALYPTGKITRRSGVFADGRQNVLVTYKHGYSAVPADIKRAALIVATSELPATNVTYSADSYDGVGESVSFGRGDGFNGSWYRYPDVVKVLRLYSVRPPGIV